MKNDRVIQSWDKIVPNDAAQARMLGHILTAAGSHQADQKHITTESAPRRKFRVRKLFISLIAAVLMMCMSFTVLGATVPAINNWIAEFSPELAALLGRNIDSDVLDKMTTVDQSVVSDGIEITLLSVLTDEEGLAVFLSIRDTENPDGETFRGLSFPEQWDVASNTMNDNLGAARFFDITWDAEEGVYLVLIFTAVGDAPQSGTIEIAWDGLGISDLSEESLVKKISNGNWSFSVPIGEPLQSKTLDIPGGAQTGGLLYFSDDEDGVYDIPQEVACSVFQVRISPITISFSHTNNLDFDGAFYGDMYLLMKDGRKIWVNKYGVGAETLLEGPLIAGWGSGSQSEDGMWRTTRYWISNSFDVRTINIEDVVAVVIGDIEYTF